MNITPAFRIPVELTALSFNATYDINEARKEIIQMYEDTIVSVLTSNQLNFPEHVAEIVQEYTGHLIVESVEYSNTINISC